MSKIEQAAISAHEAYAAETGVAKAIDMGGILEWAEIIIDLIKNCRERTGGGLKAAAKNPGLLQRVAVNRAIARNSDEPLRVVRAKGNALLKAAASAKAEDLDEVIQEALSLDD
jgi:hypothetical protein